MPWGFAAAAVGGIAAASISSSGAKDAAQTQSDAADRAAASQNVQWQQTQANLKPYMDLGQSSINPLMSAMGYNGDGSRDGNNILQQQFQYGQFNAPTAAQAQATPGYQFTQEQGLNAVQNSAAARGLGTSGAALKGAAGYATGLADSTYNDVYNRALQAYNANYSTQSGAFQTNYNSAANNANRLQGLVSSGQNAAATNGSLGAANSAAQSNLLTGAANASASGIVGSSNAMSGAINGMGNNAMMYGMMQNNAAKNTGNTQQYPAGSLAISE
jgi:hypothetical protein